MAKLFEYRIVRNFLVPVVIIAGLTAIKISLRAIGL